MVNKITKFIIKTILLFPIGIGFYMCISGFEYDSWAFPLMAGFVASLGIVFWQVFDYEKYDGMENKDFLESTHYLKVEYNSENWNGLNKILNNPLARLKVLNRTEDSLKIQIERKMLDSILTINKTQNKIEVQIENKFFNFLPDSAENYRTLRIITRGMTPLKIT